MRDPSDEGIDDTFVSDRSHAGIRSNIGAGGMGEAYRARDTRLKREVAIKILPESLRLTQIVSRDFNVGPRQLIGRTARPWFRWADL